MSAQRELVPFFPAEAPDTSAADAVASPQPPSGTKRSRRLKKKGDTGGAALSDAGGSPLAPPARSTGAKKQQTPPAKVASKGKKAPPLQTATLQPTASPKPNTTPSKLAGAFAGAAFEQSPHPKSLPKPRFAGKAASPAQGSPASLGPMDAPDATQVLRALLGVALELPSQTPASADRTTGAGGNFSLGPAMQNDATQQLCSLLGVKAC
ncbi:hypothetical protein KFE25_004257 [Diacronema lutheri]|uniref:Uncharacterized protein n=1 Tax=Diacronema lutheri TaxID=2081491 RepID=A0A8J5X916_DIALT|nr:hypothetical protein KFE25_004257 [Diacronema lutheri]